MSTALADAEERGRASGATAPRQRLPGSCAAASSIHARALLPRTLSRVGRVYGRGASGRRRHSTVEGHGGTIAIEALDRLRRHRDVHAVRRAHLPVLRRRREAARPPVRIIDVRHEQTATFAAEATAKLTRRPGVAVLTAGPGVTNGISAVTTRPVQRLAARRARRAGAAGPVGRRLAAGVRPRAGAGADHQAGDDGDRPRQECGSLVHELATLAMTPHRGPVFCDFPLDVVFGTGTSDMPRPSTRRRCAAPSPDADEVQAGRRAAGRRRAPGADRRVRRVVGRGVGRAPGRRRGAAHPDLRQRARPGLPARRSRAGVLAHPGLAQGRGRRRRRGRHAARLPPVLRHVRRRPRSCTSSTTPDRRAGHVTAAASPAGDLDADPHRSRRPRRPARRPRAVDRPAARRRDGRGGRRRAAARGRPPTRSSRRASTASCASRLDRDAVVVCDGGDFVSLRRQVHRLLRARLLARLRALRLPRHGDGLRDRRPCRPARPPGGGAARRRRRRLQPMRRRHARAPRPAGRDGRRQQRHLGPGEAPDADALRLRRRRRPPARPAATTRW